MWWQAVQWLLLFKFTVCQGPRVSVQWKGKGHHRTGHEGPEGE